MQVVAHFKLLAGGEKEIFGNFKTWKFSLKQQIDLLFYYLVYFPAVGALLLIV
jgi:hypothetical protein